MFFVINSCSFETLLNQILNGSTMSKTLGFFSFLARNFGFYKTVIMLKAVVALKLVWTWFCFIFLNGLRGHYDLWLCPTYPSNDKSFFSFSVSLTFWFRRINRIEICAIQHWVLFTTWNHLCFLSKKKIENLIR